MKSSSFRKRFSLARRILLNRPKGFFVKYPHWQSIPAAVPPYPALQSLFDAQTDQFLSRMETMSAFVPDLRSAVEEGRVPWETPGKFPRADIATTYCMTRSLAPRRILEIGSGTSTHVLSAAVSDVGTGQISCIDPEPRRDIRSLPVAFHERVLQPSDVQLLEAFEPGDLLFIDSSHLFFPGGDVDIQFNRFFPELPSGALVHVHDIFLPFGYPEDWLEKRYSEQCAMIAWLIAGYFDVLFPVYYMLRNHNERVVQWLDGVYRPDQRLAGGSLWLRRR